MSTETKKSALESAIDETIREVTFVPFGSNKSLTLTLEEARHIVANPTKTGKLPSDRDVSLFLRLCEFRGLNPYVKDAFLLGYDSKDGPVFSSVVAHSAMMKRADAHTHYAGKQSGVIVWDKDAKEKRLVEGDVVPKTLDVIGGWCRVYRKDRPDRPDFAETAMSAYSKGFGHWNVDPNWMITKSAEAKALRAAFPNDLGGMETAEEVTMRHDAEQSKRNVTTRAETQSNDDLLSVVPSPEEQAEILEKEVGDLFDRGHADATAH